MLCSVNLRSALKAMPQRQPWLWGLGKYRFNLSILHCTSVAMVSYNRLYLKFCFQIFQRTLFVQKLNSSKIS